MGAVVVIWGGFMNDPYEMVALIYAGFLCDKCLDYEDGNQHDIGATEESMAQVAKDKGWTKVG